MPSVGLNQGPDFIAPPIGVFQSFCNATLFKGILHGSDGIKSIWPYFTLRSSISNTKYMNLDSI